MLSCAVRKYADARAFTRHRFADIRAFVLGQGRRDDGADGIVVGGDSSGDVHHGSCGTNDGNSDGDGNGDGDGDGNDIFVNYKIITLSRVIIIYNLPST